MAKKTISNPIENELKGSAWFKRQEPDESVGDITKDAPMSPAKISKVPQPKQTTTVTPRHHDTTEPRAHEATAPQHPDTMDPRAHATMEPRYHDTIEPRIHDTVTPRHHATAPANVAEIISAVQQVGTESGTRRLTVAEKQDLDRIKFEYRGQKIHTSENEVVRIAIHFLLAEHHHKKEKSMLHQVLVALHSKTSNKQ